MTDYLHKTVCGHETWVDKKVSGGGAWCNTCKKYVALMIERLDKEESDE